MMGGIFNKNFIEFLAALNDADVKYVLVGGYAVILHGYNRTTGDMDVWVKPSQTNYRKLMKAFSNFGLPTTAISEDEFLNTENMDVYTFGVPPICIDILTKVKGLKFNEVYESCTYYETQNIEIPLIQYNHLIQAKRASGRHRDLNDIEQLEQE